MASSLRTLGSPGEVTIRERGFQWDQGLITGQEFLNMQGTEELCFSLPALESDSIKSLMPSRGGASSTHIPFALQRKTNKQNQLSEATDTPSGKRKEHRKLGLCKPCGGVGGLASVPAPSNLLASVQSWSLRLFWAPPSPDNPAKDQPWLPDPWLIRSPLTLPHLHE